MSRSAAVPPPVPDPGAVVQLRASLWAAGYTAPSVAKAMGTSGGFTPRPSQVPIVLRLLPSEGPLSTLVKLFLAGVAVSAADAEAALAPLGVARAAEIGLVSVSGDQVVGKVAIAPAGDLLVAFDMITDVGAELPPDVVVGVSGSSRNLADLTVRRPVESALDLGTGSGIQALLAAPHAVGVVATDSNPRALAFTRFNALLNGLVNIEVVEGDLLAAVPGRQFDLVVSNPPFVISPDADFLYRDSGRPRDSLSRDLVRGVAGSLRPGGFAHILISWVHQPDGDWSVPLRDWVAGLGCDAWLVHFRSDDPIDYATSWNMPLESDVPRYTATVSRWLDHFDAEGIGAIGYGAVILRRRAGPNWVAAQSVAGTSVGPANDQVVGLFAGRDLVVDAGGPAGLLDHRFVIDEANRLDQTLRCVKGTFEVQGAFLCLERGLPFRAAVDVYAAHLLSRMDGRRTVRQAIDDSIAVLAANVDRTVVEGRTATIVGRMVELGFLHPAVT